MNPLPIGTNEIDKIKMKSLEYLCMNRYFFVNFVRTEIIMIYRRNMLNVNPLSRGATPFTEWWSVQHITELSMVT